MLNIAIVDDEEKERAKIRKYLSFLEKGEVKFDVSEFCSAEEFLINYEPIYSIVFMDILMKGTDGMEAIKLLRKVDKTVIVVFITNMAQFAAKGYEVDALDFIVKPIDFETFKLKMKRVLGRVLPNITTSVMINEEGSIKTVNVSLVRFIEKEGHYIVYHSSDGTFKERLTLYAAYKKVEHAGVFAQCNRGQLVNLRFVTEIKKDTVVVDGDVLPLALAKRKSFLNAYAEYMSGGGEKNV